MKRNSRSIHSDDFVECRFCNQPFERITGTHLVVHETTREEYMREFGLTPDQLTAKNLRRRMATRKDYRPLSNKQMLKLVRAMLKRHSDKGSRYFKEHHYQVFAQASKMFGGWRQAARKAGTDTRLGKRSRIWTRDHVLSEIKKLHKETGSLALAKHESEHNVILLRAAVLHFGKWKSAVKAAGFDLRDLRIRQEWSKDRVLAGIRRSKRRKNLSEREFFLLTRAGIKYFGSFENALRAAGFTWEEYFEKNRWSRTLILAELKKFKDKYGEDCARKIKQEAPHLRECSRHHFGRWSEALECAGIKLPFTKWTKELFQKEARRLLKGKPTNVGYVAKDFPILLHPAKKFFGSWEKAVEGCGLEWKSKRPWNEERVKIAVMELAVGGSLQGADSRAETSLKQAVYYYFGNWNSVAKATGLKYKPRPSRNRVPESRAAH